MIIGTSGGFFYYTEDDNGELKTLDGSTILEFYINPIWIIVKEKY